MCVQYICEKEWSCIVGLHIIFFVCINFVHYSTVYIVADDSSERNFLLEKVKGEDGIFLFKDPFAVIFVATSRVIFLLSVTTKVTMIR